MSTSQETLNYCRAPENWELMTTSLVLTPYPGKATRVPLVTMMRSNSHSQTDQLSRRHFTYKDPFLFAKICFSSNVMIVTVDAHIRLEA